MRNEEPIDLNDMELNMTMEDISSEISCLENALAVARSSVRILEYHTKKFTEIYSQMEEKKRRLSA